MAPKLEGVTFYNGQKMPIIGLGTFQSSKGEVGRAIDFALETGYRHIDTAYMYGNEAEIGQALKKWLDSGKLKREELFIVTKAMEAQVDAGRARSIGLSNFNSSQIKRIWQAAHIKPANLQVELHIYFQQRELTAFCKALDVTICAYAPLGSPQLYKVVNERGGDASKLVNVNPMSEPVVSRIAEKYKKTNAQVLLRHIMQRGIVVIPKSVNPDRIKQNFNVFDFELTQEDMDELDALDKGPKCRIFNDVIAPERAKHPEYPYHERY